MAKIPLERTIETTYGFAFRKFFSVLGVLWLPTLVLACLVAAIAAFAWPDVQHLHTFMMDATQSDSEEISRERLMAMFQVAHDIGRFAGLVGLLFLVMRAMVTVGVMEKALGLRDGPVFFYFSLGAAVWRLVGAFILALIVLFVVGVLTLCAVALAWYGAEKFAAGVVGLVKFASAAAAVCWMIYAFVRLMFFLPAVVVAEGRLGLGRAWALGGGNFWRTVGLLIAVLLPFAVVAGIVSHALFGGLFMADFETAVLAGRHLQPREVLDIILRDLRDIWPVFVLYEIVTVTLVTGLGIGAVAAAYKAVTQSEASA
jgi:hypothetical protein